MSTEDMVRNEVKGVMGGTGMSSQSFCLVLFPFGGGVQCRCYLSFAAEHQTTGMDEGIDGAGPG